MKSSMPAFGRGGSAPPSHDTVDAFLDEQEADADARWASALLGTSLAQTNRLAEVAPRITDIADEAKRLCKEASSANCDAVTSASSDRSAERLAARIVGRWVMTAATLPPMAAVADLA